MVKSQLSPYLSKHEICLYIQTQLHSVVLLAVAQRLVGAINLTFYSALSW
ncbi:hypothetical protein [Nostoc sp. CMAA1605]|nr:hypothetical protein [Nostoc sp. CMAA1605]